jgi:hypothetical protein
VSADDDAAERRSIAPAPKRRSTNVGPEGFPQRLRQPSRSELGGQRPARLPAATRASREDDVEQMAILDGLVTTQELVGLPIMFELDVPRQTPPERPHRSGRRKRTRHPVVGLASLLIFTFVAAFLAWYAAGPLWLSLGHGKTGTATVVSCPVDGLNRRCADFVASDNSFTTRVALLGPRRAPQFGDTVSAQMVSRDGSAAYSGSLYARWVPSVLLLLLCGLGIAWSTGASRLPRRAARVTAWSISLLAPLLLLVGFVAATY